jgi:transcriptional regulator with XRE-family HTH domain
MHLYINDIEKKAKIRDWFFRAGLSQAQVARDLGISPQRLGHVLDGKWPTQKQIDYLKFLGMPENLLPVRK